MDSKRLVEWQERGYIKKIINKWYLFSSVLLTEHLLLRISNCIHSPSYISLDSALSFYHFIPEAVYTQQAVSTKKTVRYNTVAGRFNYQSVKPALYFGYTILVQENIPVLMADPEKALLDYLYLHPIIKTLDDIHAVRFNITALQETIDWEKLGTYARVFNSATLNKKIELLKKLIPDANAS